MYREWEVFAYIALAHQSWQKDMDIDDQFRKAQRGIEALGKAGLWIPQNTISVQVVEEGYMQAMSVVVREG